MADPIGLVLILLPHDDSTQNLSSLVALLNGMGVGNDRVQVVNTVPVGEPVMDRIRQVDGDIILLNGMVKDVYFLDNFPSSMACSCIVRSLDRTTTLAMKCASWDKDGIILALSKVALISIDSLIEKLSLSYYYFMDIPLSPPPITLDHMIIHSKCHARVGFMGNPR